MFFILLAVFILLPIFELSLLIRIGTYIGPAATIGLVLLTGAIGAYLARREGASVVQRIQQRTRRGELPTEELLHGVLVFAAGLLLITPGFFTDAVGFALLSAQCRQIVSRILKARLSRHVRSRTTFHKGPYTRSGSEEPGGDKGPVIDVEGRPVDEENGDEKRSSHDPSRQR